LDAARRVHAGYYLSLAETAEPQLVGKDQKAWLRRLDVERDNLRAALRWAIECHEDELALRMAGALQPFWFARGYWSEGRRWLEEALALDAGATRDPAVRAKALYGAGTLARFQGDFARARMLCEQSLTLCRGLADQSGVVLALVQLSRICTFQEDQTAANAFLAEAASLIGALPDTVAKAGAYTDMVLASMWLSPILPTSEAIHYLDESERIQRALNNPTGLAFTVLQQANRALLEGDDTLAASRFDEAERLARELADYHLLGRMAVSRTPLDLRIGDAATARRRLEEALLQTGTRGDHHLPTALAMLAAILYRQGLTRWAAQVFGLAEASADTSELAYMVARHPIIDVRDEVHAELGDEAFAREKAAGERMTLDDLWAIPHPPAPSPARDAAFPPPASGVSLTARELEVLNLLNQDLSNPQIAERLVVSRRTVDAHLRSIYDKLGVKSRDAATRVAREQGMIGKSGLMN
jgi:ATP/maltotriose-dependent transcriptional regulator MalT